MQTWFITGASSGLGRALAETVLAAGARAVLTAREPEKLSALVSTYPERALAVTLDLTQPASFAPALQAAYERFGTVDVLVNNAGAGLLAALEKTDDAQLEQNLEINLLGPLRLIRAALPQMRQQGTGHIISISAVAEFDNYPGFSVYGAAKAGLDAASQSLRQEVAPFGLKVSVVVPGPFRTSFASHAIASTPPQPEYDATVGNFAKLLTRLDGHQPGDPHRAAEAIYQLAQEEKPPFRLVLGKYAYQKVAKYLSAQEAELAQWKHLGEPTDFTSR